MFPILRDKLRILRVLQGGGSVIGKAVEQMCMERARQAVYSQLPIMEEVRKIRIEIDATNTWPEKVIESVDTTRDDVKLLHYQDVEKVRQAENFIFSEAVVLGIEDLVDPGMYDNFIDVIINFGKRTTLVDYNTYMEGDVHLWIDIFNRSERTMRVYFEDTLIYDSETAPRKWRHTIWDLKKIAPPPEELR